MKGNIYYDVNTNKHGKCIFQGTKTEVSLSKSVYSLRQHKEYDQFM